MKTVKKIILIAGIAAAAASCNDFLDLQPTDAVTDRLMWSKPEYAELYVNSFYTYIHDYGQFYDNASSAMQCAYGITEGLTDMMKYAPGKDNSTGIHHGQMNQFVYGETGTTAASFAFYLSNWSGAYEQIRRINEFLYSMHQYAEFDPEDVTRFEAEARFFRGMVYYELAKRYHRVIVYPENMLEYAKDTPLDTEEDTWNMVEDDLTFAAKNLPPTWSGDDAGRVTSYAAWALLSRAMLFAGRWDVVKTAAEEVKKGGFTLMPGTTSEEYAKAFSTTALNGNTESILDYSYQHGTLDHNFDYYFSPFGDSETNARGLGNPTQELVEEYEYAGGGEVDWSPWHVAGGTTDTPPYDRLEPRFGATVLYNGASWKDRTIETFEGGADGWITPGTVNTNGKTTTGYYLRKLVDETHTDLVSTKSSHPWVMIRYAEVLLNEAEAAYHLSDEGTANSCIKEIRGRVGLPYTNQSGTALWNAIRKERKLELAFEGHYFWDMLRWGVFVEEQNGTTVHGFHITKEGADTRYEYINCDEAKRSFTDRIYQCPLPEGELNNNKAVQQFQEWL